MLANSVGKIRSLNCDSFVEHYPNEAGCDLVLETNARELCERNQEPELQLIYGALLERSKL